MGKFSLQQVRDFILLVAGIVFLFIEAFVYKSEVVERPLFLAIYTAMMGLPYVFQKKSEKDQEGKEDDET